jgi:hypothetical protein
MFVDLTKVEKATMQTKGRRRILPVQDFAMNQDLQ